MRRLAVLAVFVSSGLALADPIADEELLLQILHGGARVRADAARQLRERTARGEQRALEFTQTAVLSDDPKVRVPLLEALIATRVIERASATLVPTAKVLDRRIRQLLPKENPEGLPRAADCKVTAGDARTATIECRTSVCQSACMRETRSFEITTGVRWKIDGVQSKRMDDGSCGDCM
jgi:hypothetical protein